MNKKILKTKKRDKLNNKKSFLKQDLLFIKKYPILYPICSTYRISKMKIDQTFRITRDVTLKLGIMDSELQSAIRMILVSTNQNHHFKNGSIGKFYYDLFEKEGIKL